MILLVGYSAYPRKIDFKRMRQIADACGAVLMCDMAHFAGLVAGHVYMKNYEFTLPAFSGDIDGTFSNTPNTDDVDNISVRLAYVDKNDAVHFFSEPDSAQHRTYCTRNVVGNNVYFASLPDDAHEPMAIVGGATMLPIMQFAVLGGPDTGRITQYINDTLPLKSKSLR